MPTAGNLDPLDHKALLKKQFYDSPAMQTIKNELFNNSDGIIQNSSTKSLFESQDHNFNSMNSNSYDENDFNDGNIDVESDSDDDQPLELKQEAGYLSSHQRGEESDEALLKNEEWNHIMKNKELTLSSSQSSSPIHHKILKDQQFMAKKLDSPSSYSALNDPVGDNENEGGKQKNKRILQNEDGDSEFYNDSFTESNLLNLSDRKRGKYANGKFSIENLIGRIVEDR
jgi:hypothetical protein